MIQPIIHPRCKNKLLHFTATLQISFVSTNAGFRLHDMSLILAETTMALGHKNQMFNLP